MHEIKTVPAIDKAVAIFEYLETKYDGATLSEISSSLGFAKSSTYGILGTLKQYGLVTAKENNSRFVLGPKFLSYAYAAGKSLDIVQAAYPFMVELRDALNETVKLSVKNKDSTVVISKIEAQKEHHASTKIGSRFPLHAGASGKVLLAHSSKQEIELYLQSYLAKYTEHTIVSPASLRQELETILAKGYAEDHGETFSDIRAVACPIFNHAREVTAVISIPFIVTPDEENEKQKLLSHLLRYAKKISEAMGYYGSPASGEPA